MPIVIAFLMLGFGLGIGSIILSQTYNAFQNIENISEEANDTINTTFSTIWTSMPILALVAIVLAGAAIFVTLSIFRG